MSSATSSSVPLPAAKKPKIVGIYGVPASGKTTLVNSLKTKLDRELFVFHEGSELINKVMINSGGLAKFKTLSFEDKNDWRELAMRQAEKESGYHATCVITGHAIFWKEGEHPEKHVFTDADGECYSHVVYLNPDPATVHDRLIHDHTRTRDPSSVAHIRGWQHDEKLALRKICTKKGIPFTVVARDEPENVLERLLLDIQNSDEENNLSKAREKLDEAVSCAQAAQVFVVLDADRTLAPVDASDIFWQKRKVPENPVKGHIFWQKKEEHPMKAIFKDWGFTYNAFRQAMLLNEEACNYDENSKPRAATVAQEITLYDPVKQFLRRISNEVSVHAIVLTSGLREVWHEVIGQAGLGAKVTVIGGGRLSDGFVVTPDVKTSLVNRLRYKHKKQVCAFGDSPLDLGMLRAAHQAIVVTGEGKARSSAMDEALASAIKDNKDFHPFQALLPQSAKPRLDTSKVPIVYLDDDLTVESILSGRQLPTRFTAHLATDKAAAKLLATNMRDAAFTGTALRWAHKRVGFYLATEYLTELIGLESRPITHVLGHQEFGSQLLYEDETVIMAMMRGGEPMVQGVSEVIPQSMFMHAKLPEEVQPRHVEGRRTMILVDSGLLLVLFLLTPFSYILYAFPPPLFLVATKCLSLCFQCLPDINWELIEVGAVEHAVSTANCPRFRGVPIKNTLGKHSFIL